MKPEEILGEGHKIIGPYLEQNGFSFVLTEQGKGSGGNYAVCQYQKGERIIELHYRYNLGLVNYQFGDYTIGHQDYMKLLGVYGKNHYPGFPKDYLEGFYHLLFDLRQFSCDFISGSGQQFIDLVKKLRNNPEIFKGIKGLPK